MIGDAKGEALDALASCLGIFFSLLLLLFLGAGSILYCSGLTNSSNKNKKIINDPLLIKEILVSKTQDWDFDAEYFLENNEFKHSDREIIRIKYKKNQKIYLLHSTAINDYTKERYKTYTSIQEKKCFCRFNELIISSSLKEEDKKLSELIMKVKIIHQDSIKRIEDEKTKKLQQKNYEKLLVKKPIKLSE